MVDNYYHDPGPHPYTPGTILSVWPHKPATPEEAEAYLPTKEEQDLMESGEWTDRVEMVFRFSPPQPPQPSVPDTPKKLKIHSVLLGGWFRGAQVVLCSFIEENNATYIAKIYDPLYLEDPREDRFSYDEPITLVGNANLYYTRESAAYERMEANKMSRPGLCSPNYFGSWCFRTSMCSPVDEDEDKTSDRPRERTVCLILLEYIQGTDMRRLFPGARGDSREDYERLNEGYRLYVWARLLEAVNWLEHIGIDHCDLFPRNIMLSPPPVLDDNSESASQLKSRVAIIDFDMAEVTQTTVCGALLPNPMLKWWHGYPGNLIPHWVPQWWVEDFPQRRRWLLTEFGEDKTGRYKKHEDLGSVCVLTADDEDFLQARSRARRAGFH